MKKSKPKVPRLPSKLSHASLPMGDPPLPLARELPNRTMLVVPGDFAATAHSDTVLLAVTGMSPAVLTETVWALAHPADGSAPVLPARVVVVTTVTGRDAICRQLFAPSARFDGRTPWETLRATLAGEGFDLTNQLRFGTTPDDIRVITTANPATGLSEELADLRTLRDNDAAADFVLDEVRRVVENPDTHLIASLAGGRKTMGALLYACLTLAGRETDRLTHVLVNEPFETVSEFYFPGQPGGPVLDRDKREHLPGAAVVELADVPFVPLRNLFKRELGQPAGSFRRLVLLCQQHVRDATGYQLRVEIDRAFPACEVNGTRFVLAPREHLVLLFFAERAKRGEVVLAAFDEAVNELEDYRKEVRRQAPPNDWSNWRHHESLNKLFIPEKIASRSDQAPDTTRELVRVLSDLRAKVKRAGGDAALLASVLPRKGRCALDVPGEMIFIKG
jgi:CRISPR-associated protein (TIGR02584 family)